MKASELREIRAEWFDRYHTYKMVHWNSFDYKCLNKIMFLKRSGRGGNETYNDCIIMADTETSKKAISAEPQNNHVCAWTISIRAFNRNIVTLYGHRPDTMIKCITKIHGSMDGEFTYIYFHNYAYDYVFLRKFMFDKWGYPIKQLNTKPHYPISMQFENGLVFRDSLILAQRKLEKWANDLDVEHKKSVGKWDYSKIRNQDEEFSPDELEYIEHDTLAGVECIQKTMDTLHKRIYSMPYTATGIPREDVREIGKEHNAHQKFLQIVGDYNQQKKLEKIFHGGYTHGNRHFIGYIHNRWTTKCKDFSSSYPFQLVTMKAPTEKFTEYHDCTPEHILNCSEYAFIFKLILVRPHLKNDFIPMPSLQLSKCERIINPIVDNGRVLACDYAEIYLNEVDLSIIMEQYEANFMRCVEVEAAHKNYLPRWFTDYVFSLYEEKTYLKCGDPVLYSLAKAKLNSLYGMCAQRPVKVDILEDYQSGQYELADQDEEAIYNKYVSKYQSILPYCWGVWVTSNAMRALFDLGNCIDFEKDDFENCGQWLYSDTDSIYAFKWNDEKVAAYNESCKEKLRANGYGPVLFNDREYWLGIAEDDSSYSEFCYLGAKRYAGRSKKDGELHITVAGVPKSGAVCLKDNLSNFRKGLVFPGTQTGKLLHTYMYVDDIYTDEHGNITGDSIDLSPCDYLLDEVETFDWEKIFYEEGSSEYVYTEETV